LSAVVDQVKLAGPQGIEPAHGLTGKVDRFVQVLFGGFLEAFLYRLMIVLENSNDFIDRRRRLLFPEGCRINCTLSGLFEEKFLVSEHKRQFSGRARLLVRPEIELVSRKCREEIVRRPAFPLMNVDKCFFFGQVRSLF
jgi:hypothetical protein